MTLIVPANGVGEPRSSEDCTRPVLDFVHGLLTVPWDGLQVEDQLRQLACVFRAESAGLVVLIGGAVEVQLGRTADGQPAAALNWPAERWADLAGQVHRTAKSIAIESVEDRSYLFTAFSPQEGISWLLWLQDRADNCRNASEQGAFALAALALARTMSNQEGTGRWIHRLDRARRQQRLENAARLVGRLVHDFNNVLTGVLGFTELSLGQVAPGSPAHDYMKEAYQAAQQGTQLINLLSTFSKRSTPRAEAVSLWPVVEEVQDRLGRAWPPSIDVRVQVAADLPSVAFDVEALRFVLRQLLENARESIPAKGAITLSARPRELTATDCADLLGSAAPGLHIELTVADTGTGFSPDARKRILEPFFSSKPRHRGLGLPAVYSILHSYHGGLNFEHRQEGGTAVQIYLPVVVPETTTTVSIRRSKLPLAQGEKLLIVDDDPLTLQLMCTTLERAGYRVHSAADGAQALDSFAHAAEPFRLVLSDVVMPRMTGFDLAHRLLDQDPQVQVLFTSGHVPAGFMPENLAGRSFDLLPKPFRPEGLLRAVRAALDRGPSPAGSAQNPSKQEIRQ